MLSVASVYIFLSSPLYFFTIAGTAADHAMGVAI